MVDQVKVVADDQAPAEQSLRRNLTNRHIQLIAIGGAIGTGLFMGSGKTISLAGPSIRTYTGRPARRAAANYPNATIPAR